MHPTYIPHCHAHAAALSDACRTRPVTMGALVSTLLSGAVKYLRFGLGEVAIDTMHSGTMKWLTKHHPELFVAKTATGTGK